MTLFANNPFNKDTLPYSGLIVFVFAVIYYYIQQNSYCNASSALCKNPLIINSESEPNRIIINKSKESIAQYIKCEPLENKDITTYKTMTNKSISFYAFILAVIFIIVLFITNSSMSVFTDVMFNSISTKDSDKYVTPVLNIGIAVTLLIGIANYLKDGMEFESVLILLISFIAISIITIVYADRSKPHIALQAEILLIICIAIAFICITNFRYIYNLQIGHAFISSGAFITLVIQLIVIVLMGISLFDNYGMLSTNTIEYILYIIVFITILIQTGGFASHTYNCVWKTYDCVPEINGIKTDRDVSKVNISCNAKLNIGNSIFSFVILAILFVILPSDWAIDYIADFIKNMIDAVKDLLN